MIYFNHAVAAFTSSSLKLGSTTSAARIPITEIATNGKKLFGFVPCPMPILEKIIF